MLYRSGSRNINEMNSGELDEFEATLRDTFGQIKSRRVSHVPVLFLLRPYLHIILFMAGSFPF